MGAMNVNLTADDIKAVDALNGPGDLCRDIMAPPFSASISADTYAAIS